MGMTVRKVAVEQGKKGGEVILYEVGEGKYRVYRDIPGVGMDHDTGSDFFDDEEEARKRFEELTALLKRINA